MARTRIKSIDDSKPGEEVKKPAKKGQVDTLLESLKAELGEIEPKKKRIDSVSSNVDIEAGESKIEEINSPSSNSQDQAPSLQTPSSKKVHPKQGKTKYRSKKYLAASKGVDPETHYPLSEAIDLVKSSSYSKFDGSLEAHLNTKIKNLRGSVSLPFASAKKKVILAFGKGAENSGADQVGDDSKISQIQAGKIDFDTLITTPEWMSKLASLAKVLGPRGLMPNPKNGTITENLEKAIEGIQTGKTDYKSENNGKVIHLSIGKISQPTEELEQNMKVLLSSIGKSKLSKVVLSPSMGPGIKLDLGTI